ncbi:MAG: CDGSH iron-sulfur domain-containing protein, partial [Woeseiaceae bacterium]
MLNTNFRRRFVMDKPVVFAKEPAVLELDPDTYYWCSCGKSASQPFCDNAHGDGEFGPLPFVVNEKKTVALCNCKNTKTPPYCDGSHNNL